MEVPDELELAGLVWAGTPACRCLVCDAVHTPVEPLYQTPHGVVVRGSFRSRRGLLARNALPHVGYGADLNRCWRDYAVCSAECWRIGEAHRHRLRRRWEARFREPSCYTLRCERVGCGAEFTASRPDARYCSGRCRVAAHRARQASLTAG